MNFEPRELQTLLPGGLDSRRRPFRLFDMQVMAGIGQGVYIDWREQGLQLGAQLGSSGSQVVPARTIKTRARIKG